MGAGHLITSRLFTKISEPSHRDKLLGNLENLQQQTNKKSNIKFQRSFISSSDIVTQLMS